MPPVQPLPAVNLAGTEFATDTPAVVMCGSQSANKSSLIDHLCVVGLPRSDSASPSSLANKNTLAEKFEGLGAWYSLPDMPAATVPGVVHPPLFLLPMPSQFDAQFSHPPNAPTERSKQLTALRDAILNIEASKRHLVLEAVQTNSPIIWHKLTTPHNTLTEPELEQLQALLHEAASRFHTTEATELKPAAPDTALQTHDIAISASHGHPQEHLHGSVRLRGVPEYEVYPIEGGTECTVVLQLQACESASPQDESFPPQDESAPQQDESAAQIQDPAGISTAGAKPTAAADTATESANTATTTPTNATTPASTITTNNAITHIITNNATAQTTHITTSATTPATTAATSSSSGTAVAAAGTKTVKRPPVSLTCVLDVSGSMEGPKLEMMQAAVCHLISCLDARDSLALVAVSDRVEVLLPLMAMTHQAQQLATAGVQGLAADGGTALYDGLVAGLVSQVREWLDPHAVRAVLLCTDGQANEGPQDGPAMMAALSQTRDTWPAAWAHHADDVAVHTVGFGDDHDARVLQAVAVALRGRYSYLADPASDMAAAFGEVLGGLMSTVAVWVRLSLKGCGGAVVTAVTAAGQQMNLSMMTNRLTGTDVGGDLSGMEGDGGDEMAITVPIKDLAAGESQEVVVKLTLPPATGTAQQPMATPYSSILKAEIQYHDISQLIASNPITAHHNDNGSVTDGTPSLPTTMHKSINDNGVAILGAHDVRVNTDNDDGVVDHHNHVHVSGDGVVTAARLCRDTAVVVVAREDIVLEGLNDSTECGNMSTIEFETETQVEVETAAETCLNKSSGLHPCQQSLHDLSHPHSPIRAPSSGYGLSIESETQSQVEVKTPAETHPNRSHGLDFKSPFYASSLGYGFDYGEQNHKQDRMLGQKQGQMQEQPQDQSDHFCKLNLTKVDACTIHVTNTGSETAMTKKKHTPTKDDATRCGARARRHHHHRRRYRRHPLVVVTLLRLATAAVIEEAHNLAQQQPQPPSHLQSHAAGQCQGAVALMASHVAMLETEVADLAAAVTAASATGVATEVSKGGGVVGSGATEGCIGADDSLVSLLPPSPPTGVTPEDTDVVVANLSSPSSPPLTHEDCDADAAGGGHAYSSPSPPFTTEDLKTWHREAAMCLAQAKAVMTQLMTGQQECDETFNDDSFGSFGDDLDLPLNRLQRQQREWASMSIAASSLRTKDVSGVGASGCLPAAALYTNNARSRMSRSFQSMAAHSAQIRVPAQQQHTPQMTPYSEVMSHDLTDGGCEAGTGLKQLPAGLTHGGFNDWPSLTQLPANLAHGEGDGWPGLTQHPTGLSHEAGTTRPSLTQQATGLTRGFGSVWPGLTQPSAGLTRCSSIATSWQPLYDGMRLSALAACQAASGGRGDVWQ